jgi:hypothetical protein
VIERANVPGVVPSTWPETRPPWYIVAPFGSTRPGEAGVIVSPRVSKKVRVLCAAAGLLNKSETAAAKRTAARKRFIANKSPSRGKHSAPEGTCARVLLEGNGK